MIDSVTIGEDNVFIPVLETNALLVFPIEEFQDYLGVNKKCECGVCPSASENLFCAMPTKFALDDNIDIPVTSFSIYIYDASCFGEDYTKYLIISLGEINKDLENLHCVAIPNNRLNLLKFYKDYCC